MTSYEEAAIKMGQIIAMLQEQSFWLSEWTPIRAIREIRGELRLRGPRDPDPF